MGIGTSDGQYFEDDLSYAMEQPLVDKDSTGSAYVDQGNMSPNEAAAYRIRQSVQPDGGRKGSEIQPDTDEHNQIVQGLVQGALFLVPTVSDRYDKKTQEYVQEQIKYGDDGKYKIVDDQGKVLGSASVSYNPEKKNISVGMVSADETYYRQKRVVADAGKATELNPLAHILGTKDILELAREAKRVWPEAETISGLRISGAHFSGVKKYEEALQKEMERRGYPEYPEKGTLSERARYSEVQREVRRQLGPMPMSYQKVNLPKEKPMPTLNPAVLEDHVDAPGGNTFGMPGLRITDLY